MNIQLYRLYKYGTYNKITYWNINQTCCLELLGRHDVLDQYISHLKLHSTTVFWRWVASFCRQTIARMERKGASSEFLFVSLQTMFLKGSRVHSQNRIGKHPQLRPHEYFDISWSLIPPRISFKRSLWGNWALDVWASLQGI